MTKLNEVLTRAIRDLLEQGYSADRVADWEAAIRLAIAGELPPLAETHRKLRASMSGHMNRALSPGNVRKLHPGIDLSIVDMLMPQFRASLDERILSAANLIKLNREQAIDQTLKRFAGWSSSIPAGGSKVPDAREARQHIAKPLRSQKYEERRVAIDQGHKLLASVNAVIAEQTGAIAARWRSHWRQPGYDYRPDHRERDEKIYAIRGNWAAQAGLMKKGPAGYLDDITQPGEEVFCRCYVVYLNALRDLPEDMLTKKGKAELARVRL